MAEKYGKKVKEKMINEVKGIVSDEKGFVLSSIENIKASEIDVFRKKVRQSGSKYFVLKNRLASIAFKEAGVDELVSTMDENKIFGVGVIKEDPVRISKLMAEFAKENKGFNISKGYLEGRVLDEARIKELAELPSREQLIATVVGMINAPIANFVGVLSGVLRSLVYALNAVKEKKEAA